jgi:hypothetical protein
MRKHSAFVFKIKQSKTFFFFPEDKCIRPSETPLFISPKGVTHQNASASSTADMKTSNLAHIYRFGVRVTSPPGRQDGNIRDRIKGFVLQKINI